MTLDELEQWASDFERFHARFAPLFRRSEPRQAARQYLRGLLSSVRRKNTWQMAEALGERDPQRLQRLLFDAEWDADALRDELQSFVVEEFGHPEGIGVLDETSFVKKGTHSVGVKRQYCGTLGKRENCQVGVFLSYVSEQGHTFLDRRLYLPEEWAQDEPRRKAAKVPKQVSFQSKPALGVAMLEHAWQRGVPMRWVTGDEGYADAPYLRDRIAQEGLWYVLAVSCSQRVWRQRPPVEGPQQQTGGRPRHKERLAAEAAPAQSVAEVVAAWPASLWMRFAVGAGEKGPRLYDWACERVIECREGLPGAELCLIARRSVSAPDEIAYYLSNAPIETPLATMAQGAGARWSVEQCFEEGKGETGLDEYEVRYWPSWHRHITLSMMAHAWLASIRRQQRSQEEADAAKKSWHRSVYRWPKSAYRKCGVCWKSRCRWRRVRLSCIWPGRCGVEPSANRPASVITDGVTAYSMHSNMSDHHKSGCSIRARGREGEPSQSL